MLALTLATTMLVQAPQDMKSWVDQDGDATRPNSYVVSGEPELTPVAAWESARTRAREERQERLLVIGRRYLDRHVPAWLPDFVSDRVLSGWCAEQARKQRLDQLDRDLVVRDHDFAKSYQGFLLLKEPESLAATPASLGHRLDRASDGFVRRCGAVGALWGMLALGAFWLDRLTRGYMTMRLALLAIAGSVAGPFIIMLL